jgi:nucleotide-binding universal stress UspA family protein
MFRSLLVPLDGSAFAEHALPFALSIARRAGAALNIARVHVPLAFVSADGMTPFDLTLDQQVIEGEREYLGAAVKRLASSSVPVTSTFLEGPAAAEALNAHAATTKPDLIVMTTHGRGPLSRLWLGSVADELLRRATGPLLLVRPQEAAPDLASEPVLRHLLIPLDGSPLAEQVLEPALELGKLMEADYTLVRIYYPLEQIGMESYALGVGLVPPVEKLRTEAERYLDRMAQRLHQQGYRVRTQAVLGAQPASAILDQVEQLGVDGIALETHGRGGITRLLLGSVADKVLRGASVPLLVHRSAEKQA